MNLRSHHRPLLATRLSWEKGIGRAFAGVGDRAKVVAEWFGALPVDEYPIYEQPLTRRLADDRNEVARAFGRFEKFVWVVAFVLIGSVLVAQAHAYLTRQPAPVVGSYYLDKNPGQR